MRSLPLRCLLTIGLLFCLNAVQAQDYNVIAFRIDSLAAMGLPKSALKEVDKLDELARKNNNAPQQVRAVIYRMTFQSYLQEDALAAIISRLKADITRADYPVKPVLQSLLAQMYWNYYQQNRYQFSQRTRLLKPDSDFTRWDLQSITNEISRLYQLSLADASKEQHTPMSVLDGVLDGDSSTRYLRPTLYDLLVQRAFDFFLTDEASLTRPRLPFSLNDVRFFGDSRAFAGLQIQTTDTASTVYKGIKYLQQATLFHLENLNEEALADLDLQRMKFLYDKSNVEHKDSLYLSELTRIANQFSTRPACSEALVLQGQYYQGIDSLTIAYGLFKKAADAYPKSLGGKNAGILIRQLEEKTLSATVESVNTSDKPILALLNYRNLSGAKMTLYKLSELQLQQYMDQRDAGSYSGNKQKLKMLQTIEAVQTKSIVWPLINDLHMHSFEFKIDPLHAGNYVMLLRDTLANNDSVACLSVFKVSNLAYIARINPDGFKEIRVMNRETGKPLKNVKLNLTERDYRYNSKTQRNEFIEAQVNGVSDKNGLFRSDKLQSEIAVRLVLGNDTLSENQRYVYGEKDDTNEDPENKTFFFTDRQIYRPGQTIYFKALQLQTLKGKSKIVQGKSIAIEFRDVNNKVIATLNLTTNEFGTAVGSFVIPQTMLDGEITLQTDDGNINVKVEEYKRPSFQIVFLPVTGAFKLNDSVTVCGTVTAFSGYGLSLAKVAYNVTRLQTSRYYNIRSGSRASQTSYRNIPGAEIKTDTIIADNQGHFVIEFLAASPEIGENGATSYTFQINADVTDESGETHSNETDIIAGINDIKIATYIPDQMLVNETLTEPVTITNLNGQLQKGTIATEVYSLKSGGQIFKKRLWREPDQYIINRKDFKSDFPGYAYANEDIAATWPRIRKLIDTTYNADSTKETDIMLSALGKQAPGEYLLKISARNEKGDTVSLIKFIRVLGEGVAPSKFDDWVIPVINEIKPGDTASFLVGVGKKLNVLMERYDGTKLISAKWITIHKGLQPVKIPLTDTCSDMTLQFMMVYQNRIYNSYQEIVVSNAEPKPVIKLLTFHNKLQPGQKEQWRLRVTNSSKGKLAAEMVANLYDASLDDITPPEKWSGILDPLMHYGLNYFYWQSNGFIQPEQSYPVINHRTSYFLLTQKYERLDLFGYKYYGGYNSAYSDYLRLSHEKMGTVRSDKELQAEYLKYASEVKDGYDITGRVVGADDKLSLAGAGVKIKGTNIQTLANSAGYFKLKVPINGILIVSYIGYETQEVAITRPGDMVISLSPASSALNEVVVVGYGTEEKKDITGAVSVVTMSYAKKIDPADSESLLQGQAAGVAEYDKLYDTSLFQEVSAMKKQSAPIALRKNFNETAFFYPQLHTDDKGEIAIDFTIPEALTRWRFRGFAHTQTLQTGYIEAEVVTQKQLSISANTPRFLREGDTITISARLANLTAGKLTGKVQLQLFNALNMQPVNLFVNAADAGQDFEVAANTNKAVSFKLVIPAGLDALDYKLTADAGIFSDGEENTLPVLPNRTLVTESMPMMVRPGQTRDFTFDKLVNQHSATLKNKTLTLEFTPNPAWYAVQALPYMMEFPYECSEQVFTRYFANSLAVNIVSKMPAIKRVFDQWKTANSTELLSNLEKNEDLKSTLIEETPWLRDSENETEQKKRIALLFDLNKMGDELKLNLDKLQKRQLPGGGFTWFGGDYPDRYITQHIAEGIGELYHIGIGKDNAELQQIAVGALAYLDGQIIADEKQRLKNPPNQRFYNDMDIYSWYARSFYLDNALDKDLQTAQQAYFKWAMDAWKFRNVYEQGLIALTMQRYGKSDITKQIERSLLETVQQSDDLGMYWAKNQLGYYWYESPVETQSLLIDLFTETGDNTKAVDEMKIWLLRNKQTSDWKTTRATAAACYALLLKGSNLLADSGSASIKLGGKELTELKPDTKADAGTGYIKTSWTDEQIKPSYGKVEIANHGTTIGWGALHWQYLENLDKITSAQTNIHLQRKYFIQKQGDAGAVLTEVDATHQPKTGDLLKVVVYLKADRDFEYVQLKDMRPAGTEPVEALSAYKYQDGLYYYQVTKDVATNFFISQLGKGSYVFEYALRVAQPGNFSTGITNMQCMYAPEFNAHSEGGRLTVRP